MVMMQVTWTWRIWFSVVIMMAAMMEVVSLNGPNVCMVQQKYNITKRVKYRAPMSVRTYEWCFAMPPRCSKWKTEMRELTKLEMDCIPWSVKHSILCDMNFKFGKLRTEYVSTIYSSVAAFAEALKEPTQKEWSHLLFRQTISPFLLVTDERIAEVAVCCPGYKMKDVSCVPICPNGKTGHHCADDCPPNKWGPNCVNECDKACSEHGTCSPVTGNCSCQEGWQGESCESRVTTTTSTEVILTLATKPTPPTILSTTASPASTIPITTTTQANNSTLSTELFEVITTPKITKFEISTNQIITTSELPVTMPPTVAAIPKSEATTKMTVPTTLATTAATESTSNVPSTIKEVDVPSPKTTVNIDVPSSTESLPTKKPTAAPKTTVHISTENKEVSLETTTKALIITTSNQPFTVKPTEKIEKQTAKKTTASIYNRTEAPHEKQNAKDIFVEVKTIPISKIRIGTTESSSHKAKFSNLTTHIPNTILTTTEAIKEVTKRPEATIRYFPTTVKFKPKEIWIRPAQKGESIEAKNKDIRHKSTNHAPNTTPKTIIVSIIPTSVSYTTFKKVALTSSTSFKANTSSVKGTEVTKPMFVTTPPPNVSLKNKSTELHLHKVTTSTKELPRTIKGTNSMTEASNFTTVPSTNIAHKVTKSVEKATKHPFIKIVTVKPRNVTIITISGKNNDTIKITKTIAKDVETTNVTKHIEYNRNNENRSNVTESPEDEEFHILTEPEHITAVMDSKGKEITSVDLISVISIAGGIMMAVITVAVIIVMIERCKRPRYEDVGKMNDIHMQVMIDNNDVPPPYVRSIFHTPLPDPPTSEKCHYQPISTLDRNLKQFMRPVVVQTISPIMLENFRGILECHYDHLPRRSYNYEVNKHCSVPPSMDDVNELTCLRPCSIAESTIDALKCEARLDMIDNTTSEPLYAEIPCWRPPSEHAIEVINMNGEAVTEL